MGLRKYTATMHSCFMIHSVREEVSTAEKLECRNTCYPNTEVEGAWILKAISLETCKLGLSAIGQIDNRSMFTLYTYSRSRKVGNPIASILKSNV